MNPLDDLIKGGVNVLLSEKSIVGAILVLCVLWLARMLAAEIDAHRKTTERIFAAMQEQARAYQEISTEVARLCAKIEGYIGQ